MRMRTGILAALVAAALLAGGTGHALAHRADDKVDKARAAKRDADAGAREARVDLVESSARLAAAEAAYGRLERQIPAAKADLAEARGRLTAARADDAEAARRLAAAEQAERVASLRLAATAERLAAQQQEVAALVQHAYRHGSTPMLNAIAVSGSIGDLTAQMMYIDQLSASQGAILERIRGQRAQLVVDTRTLQQRRDEVAEQRAEAAERLRLTEELTTRAAAAERTVNQLLDEQHEVVSRARRDRAADQARYAEMRAESRRLEQVIAAEMRRTRGSGQSGKSSGAVPAGGLVLSYPARGRITSPYGMRTHPILGYRKLHTGVDFGLPSGTRVAAARGGRVLESYYHLAYGNRVVISHGYVNGVHLTTTYNHLSRRQVHSGERVDRGQAIGLSGNTGWSTGPHLHVEVLVNGRFRDPMRWL